MHHLKGKLSKFSGGGPPDPPPPKKKNYKGITLCFEFHCNSNCLANMQDVPPPNYYNTYVNLLWTPYIHNCSYCDICIVLSSARNCSTHFQRIFEQPGLTPELSNLCNSCGMFICVTFCPYVVLTRSKSTKKNIVYVS